MVERTYLRVQRAASESPAAGPAEAQPPAETETGPAPVDPRALADKVYELWRRDIANERLRRGGTS